MLGSCGFYGYATRRMRVAGHRIRARAYAKVRYPDDLFTRIPSVLKIAARHLVPSSLPFRTMSAHRFLDVPELVSIVFDFVVETGYDQGTRSSLYMNRRWHDIAKPRLWANVDLAVVLRHLTHDAWYIYNVSGRSLLVSHVLVLLHRTTGLPMTGSI